MLIGFPLLVRTVKKVNVSTYSIFFVFQNLHPKVDIEIQQNL